MLFRSEVSEEVMLAGGYAYRLAIGDRTIIDLGIMPKGFILASIGNRMSLDELMAVAMDPVSALESPLTMISGVGFDVGARLSLDRELSVGIVARDAYSPAMVTVYESFGAFTTSPQLAKVGESTYAVVPPDLSFGVAWEPHLTLLDKIGRAHV